MKLNKNDGFRLNFPTMFPIEKEVLPSIINSVSINVYMF